VTHGRHTVLIVGASGAGKTTTALALLQAPGSTWRADDKVLLTTTGGALRGISLYRNTNVAPATIRAFAALQFAEPRPPLDATNDKRACLLDEVTDAVDLRAFEPTALIFPSQSGTRDSHLAQMDATTVLLRLAGQSPMSSERGRARAHHDLLCRLEWRPRVRAERGNRHAAHARGGRDACLRPPRRDDGPAMSGLRLSVVIPVLDKADSIGPCLDALLAQSYPRALTEIVVVDNGSTDGTRAIVERYPVTCLVERRPGAPSARNRGIEAATGDYVVFTDADCVPVRTWLARLAAAATAHDADAVGGGLAVLDPSASLLARYSAVIGQYDPDATLRHPRYPYAATANVAIRRSLLQAAGGFDPSFTTYDAAELFWRLSQARPLATALEPRALVFYRTRSTVAALARQNFNYGVGARFP
jgi:hypothetical protein